MAPPKIRETHTVDEAVGPPPANFDERIGAVWNEVVGLLKPHKVGTSDRLVIELLCVLLHRMRMDPAAMSPAMAAQLRGCITALGLSPVDRHRTPVTPPMTAEEELAERFF